MRACSAHPDVGVPSTGTLALGSQHLVWAQAQHPGVSLQSDPQVGGPPSLQATFPGGPRVGRGTFQGCLPPFPRGGRPQDLTGFWILLCSGEAFIPSSRNHFSQCQALLNKITSVNPQTEIDGLRNIWIIKPAAKSRGRGESQPGACVDSRPR